MRRGAVVILLDMAFVVEAFAQDAPGPGVAPTC